MIQDKKSFPFYYDYLVILDLISDEDAGKVLKSLLRYGESGVIPELPQSLLITFTVMRQQMDRDAVKWEKTKEERSAAGQKGGINSGESRRRSKQNEANEANDSKVKQIKRNSSCKGNCNSQGNINILNNEISEGGTYGTHQGHTEWDITPHRIPNLEGFDVETGDE